MYNSSMRKFYVKDNSGKVLLSKYITNIFPNLKKSVLYKSLRNKDIRVNNIKISNDILLNNNDLITIYITDNLLFDLPKSLDYIYVDDNIIAVYKPQGLLSNIECYSGENIDDYYSNIGGKEPTLDELVKKDYPNSKICHRLDRNTAGIVIFANNNKTYDLLLEAFKKDYIKKEYIAYVSNSKFDKNSETLEKYILKDSKTGYSIVYDNQVKDSQKIITKYTVIEKNNKFDYAILSILIPTGKTHQIRAQMKQINHPLIGDPKYGRNEVNKKFKIYKQMLFAYKYTFNFPTNSSLEYLNNLTFKLDNSIYTKKLGE